MVFPKNLKYTEDHEWVRIENEYAYIGITNHAQNELGDIVYVDIESEGQDLEKGEVFGSIEAVKTVSDLFMPVSGTVEEANEALADTPELINSDPYGEAWIIKVKWTNDSEFEELMSVEDYEAHLA